MEFPMVATLVSKSKLKSFNFASNLSKATSFLKDIDSQNVLPPPPPLKRAREAVASVEDATDCASSKKRCLETTSQVKPAQVVENKPLLISARPKKDVNENFRRLNMKGNGGGSFKGKNSKFLSKGAKFKRRMWSNKMKSGTVRYGVGVKRSDSDDEGAVNHNLIALPPDEEESKQVEEKVDEMSNEAVFARLAKTKQEEAAAEKKTKKKKPATSKSTKAPPPTNKENAPKKNVSRNLVEKKSNNKNAKRADKKLKETQNEEPKHIEAENEQEPPAEDEETASSPEIEHVAKITGPAKPLLQLDANGRPLEHLPLHMLKLLEKHFGHKSFKPHQEEAIVRILSGLSTLVVLSTGYGKSLIYQFCAKAYGEAYADGSPLVLVVSPLISLMQDQVKNLSKSLRAAVCDSQMSERDFNALREALALGRLNVLFMSPEAILARKIRNMPRLAFACIDEVHCLSQWSHNFRPSYLLLSKILIEEYDVKCILGLTATATQGTIDEIRGHFDIDPGNILRDCDLPSNLLISVSRDSNKEAALLALLKSQPFREAFSDHVIIYCSRREQTERLAQMLRLSLTGPSKKPDLDKLRKRGKDDDEDEDGTVSNVAEAYHAGLNAHQRRRIQNQFVRGRVKIIVATMAFGMGIDMANIRAVIHYNMPKSIENYVQEIGRAGRDSNMSLCHLFLETHREDINEIKRYVHMNGYDRLTIKKFVSRVFQVCKCGEGEPSRTNDDTESDQFSKHHVALGLSETVDLLDIKEEAILTLLCYLQSADHVRIESNCYRYATLRSYKGFDFVRDLASKSQFVNQVMCCSREQSANSELQLDVMQLCERTRLAYPLVRQKLKSLEWGAGNGKSGISVEFQGPSFYVRRRCVESPAFLDDLNELLWSQVASHNEFAYANFKSLFRMLNERAHESVHDLIEKLSASMDELAENSRQLKINFNDYFNNRLDINELARDYNFGLVNSDNSEFEMKRLVADIRKFLSVYEGEFKANGNVIARIFHGIGTPKFPNEVWGRNRNFWRSHLEFDFDRIVKIATETLLKF